ncbi:MAG: energy-coupling factor transporter transmembrane protein EcfT [Ruminococcaceae bacterium]|nr:energy-coupling factor transporter transmembrane protein EcfT [Oscillospiraceae bacterium]
MNFDIAFGQYCEGASPLHKLDPRAKIIMSLLFIVDIFMAKSVWAFALLAAATAGLVITSRIPLKVILRGLRPVIIIMVFTAVINIFWYAGETLLVSFWVINIYLEGIYNAFLIVLRVILLLMGTCVILTYTTTPLALTDGLEQLLSPLAKLKVPVHEFSLMMTIALRFIPTLIEETNKIMNAQKARGADFSEGSLIKRAKALIPILVPLFASAFRRADELAVAMECRCYRGGEGRTRMNVLKASVSDVLWVLVLVLLGAAVIFINRNATGFAIGW